MAARIPTLGASLLLLIALAAALALAAGAAGERGGAGAGADDGALAPAERAEPGSSGAEPEPWDTPRLTLGPLALSLERSCPPPGILACRHAIRVATPLGGAVFSSRP